MNKYLRLLTDANFRFNILNALGVYRYLPDEAWLKKKFKLCFGEELDLSDPKGFNEKLQWLKLYDRKRSYTTMVDKCEAKRLAAERIGEEHIIPTLGVWDSFDEIDFDNLPNQFVLKCTHDSGGLVICRDKSKLDMTAARKKLEKSLKRNYYYASREWPYKDVPPRILAEQYMEDETPEQGLTDYKFFCFHGEPRMIYVSRGLEDHQTAQISFYDMQGDPMPFRREDYRPIESEMKLPENFAQMTEVARSLAQLPECPFIRIDLYSICGKLYFSEFTFSPCSGMIPFKPKEWNKKLGEWITLPKSGF